MRTLPVALLFAGALSAQQVAAPTPDTVGSSRGENLAGYNIVNSFETGYRFHMVDGNLDRYRSDVNFGNGVRLLSSNLWINSREGHGLLFDELLLTTQGLGNDPYQMAKLRIGKNKLYQYDLVWRLSDYHNPGLIGGIGQHYQDTQRTMQDHDLTLFPRSKIRLFLGYSRNRQDGPALTTIQAFDDRGDEFPLFSNVRRVYNEYRIGGEARVAGFRINIARTWENFREDTTDSLAFSGLGNSITDKTLLTQFSRSQPYHGNTPSWRLGVFRESNRWFAFNGKLSYAEGQRDFVVNEFAAGLDRFSNPNSRQILSTGTGRRPVTVGNATISVFPSSTLTVTNQTSFNRIRMEGNSQFQEFDFATQADNVANFQYLGLEAITNSTDLNYRPRKWIGLFGGYHFTNRKVASIEQFAVTGFSQNTFYEQESTLHSGSGGIRISPIKPLTIVADGEIGRADRPFYTTSERNYHALGGRVQYKRGPLLLSAQSKTSYNTNSISLSFHTARSRSNSVDASWTPRSWFSFDASYAKIHLDTLTAIAYYLNRSLVSGDRSLYISNIHTGTAGVRFDFRKRADLYLGFTRVQDVGDGRAILTDANAGAIGVLPFLAAAQVYPLSFDSPLARLSVPLREKLRFNVGYQRYRYQEAWLPTQNYGAGTGYASLLWSF